MAEERIELSTKERERLKVLHEITNANRAHANFRSEFWITRVLMNGWPGSTSLKPRRRAAPFRGTAFQDWVGAAVFSANSA